jgi:hypothetical protein
VERGKVEVPPPQKTDGYRARWIGPVQLSYAGISQRTDVVRAAARL